MSLPAKIRVLVVDDSVVVRRMLTSMLATDPAIEVIGAAANGKIALARIPQYNPDCGETPEAIANAIASGSATKPTVTPARRSAENLRQL